MDIKYIMIIVTVIFRIQVTTAKNWPTMGLLPRTCQSRRGTCNLILWQLEICSKINQKQNLEKMKYQAPGFWPGKLD